MTIAMFVGTGREIISVSAQTSVSEAVRLLAEKRIGAMPVVEGDTVHGIISERDILYALARDGAAILDWPVERVMTAPAITITGARGLLDALALMTKRRVRHLPVVEEGRLVGFVSIGDLVKARMDRIEAEAAALRDYIQQA